MKSRIWQFVLVGVFLVAGVAGAVSFGILNQQVKKYPDNGLPILDISLKDTDLETIKSGEKMTVYEGNEVLLRNGGVEDNFYNVELRGRGNSTWEQAKKPFQIKFRHAVDILGLGKARKWVLLANYFDDTNLRNDIAFYLAEMLGEEGARGRFVELYFNGEYEGLYYLVHKVEIGKSSVDLRDEAGVLFELDAEERVNGNCSRGTLGGCLVMKEAVNNNDEIEENIAHLDFMEDFYAAEEAASIGDYEGVGEYLDMISFAKYFLISEFTVDPDAYSMSFFMHKDGPNDKIHAGPIWDFDFALGNQKWAWWANNADFFSPETLMQQKKSALGLDGEEENMKISKLLYYLMEMPEFQNLVKDIFNQKLSGRVMELEVMMSQSAKNLHGAILRDTEKWEKGDFDTEMKYLLDWIHRRYLRLEKEFGDEKNAQRAVY